MNELNEVIITHETAILWLCPCGAPMETMVVFPGEVPPAETYLPDFPCERDGHWEQANAHYGLPWY